MSFNLVAGDPFIFMKVGIHAKESLEDIIRRKREEIAKAGVSFWGYGGGTCHPLTAVQPFAKEQEAKGLTVHLIMQEISSRHFAEPVRAEEYSVDGLHWQKVHPDINVLGSRYALVIESLDEVDFAISLNASAVGVGRMKGTSGKDYIRGHVDKACLVYTPGAHQSSCAIQMKLAARVAKPHAVLLKSTI